MTNFAATAQYPVIRSRPQRAALSPSLVPGMIGALDALCVILPGLAIFAVYVGWEAENAQLYLSAITIATILILGAFFFAGLYKLEIIGRLSEQFRLSLASCVVVFLTLVTVTFALKVSAQFSRVWAFSFFLLSGMLICAVRTACYYFLRRSAMAGRLCRNLVIVGSGERTNRLIAEIKKSGGPWDVIVGIFDDRVGRRSGDSDLPILGDVEDLIDYARKDRIDDIIVSLPWSAEERIRDIVTRLSVLPADIHLGSDLAAFAYPTGTYGPLGGAQTLRVVDKPLAGWKAIIKFLEDKILATILLVLLSPLMMLVALAIRFDSKGPVIFRQARYGLNNRPFFVFKFRTMYQNGVADPSVKQARRDDPRVTRVGRFLRRTSLDELPQLFNVLEGSMSLVGPRPHAVPHNEKFDALIRGYSSRHRMKPGITGWAQIRGLRGETKTREKMKARVEHDVWYIEHWSLLRDLYILAMTAWVVWGQKNAY